MFVKYHAASSAIVSGALYALTGSPELSAASFVFGVFIDADHTLEYLLEYGASRDIRRFVRLTREARYRRVFYVLHSWELLFLVFLAAWAAGWNAWLLGALAGFGLHLVLDQVGNKTTAWSYFFFWRWRQDFEHARCFPGMAEYLSRRPDA